MSTFELYELILHCEPLCYFCFMFLSWRNPDHWEQGVKQSVLFYSWLGIFCMWSCLQFVLLNMLWEMSNTGNTCNTTDIFGVGVPPICSDLVLPRKDVSHKENSIRKILSLIRKMPQVLAVLQSCGWLLTELERNRREERCKQQTWKLRGKCCSLCRAIQELSLCFAVV